MTTNDQLSLFSDTAPAPHTDCVFTAACKTCGATPPDGHRGFWLEPVSGECFDCNHKTLAEYMDALKRGDQAAASAAYDRHYPRGVKERQKKAEQLAKRAAKRTPAT